VARQGKATTLVAILGALVLCGLLCIIVALVMNDSEKPDPIPKYQIEEIEDISVVRAVRFRVRVATEFPISIEQINRLCEQVVEDQKDKGPLNAVVVFLYDTRSLRAGSYSIAKCEYTPNGVWADAVNVRTGDYATHLLTYDYMPKVHDPQAALLDRPSEQEFDLSQQWHELAFELLSKPENVDVEATETFAFEQVAHENGLSVQAVEEAVLKGTVWSWR